MVIFLSKFYANSTIHFHPPTDFTRRRNVRPLSLLAVHDAQAERKDFHIESVGKNRHSKNSRAKLMRLAISYCGKYAIAINS